MYALDDDTVTVGVEAVRRPVAAGHRLRRLMASAIGAGAVVVGAYQYAAPRRAARQFGICLGSDPTATIMRRGAGARDLVTGSALLYAAARGGDFGPWIAIRAAADAADGVAGMLTWLERAASARQRRTTSSALLLSGLEFLLRRTAARDESCPRG